MIAGGSGITPMWQIMQQIKDDKDDKTKVTLIYTNKEEKDILMKEEVSTECFSPRMCLRFSPNTSSVFISSTLSPPILDSKLFTVSTKLLLTSQVLKATSPRGSLRRTYLPQMKVKRSRSLCVDPLQCTKQSVDLKVMEDLKVKSMESWRILGSRLSRCEFKEKSSVSSWLDRSSQHSANALIVFFVSPTVQLQVLRGFSLNRKISPQLATRFLFAASVSKHISEF